MTEHLHIGTSGWSYYQWKGAFYPEGMKQADWLTFYAQHFDTTEINYSFYHLPKPQTVLNWAAKVPEGFRFCAKISKTITHFAKLKETEELVKKFFESFGQIRQMLGPVLVQVPPSLKFDEALARPFFEMLKHNQPEYEFAFEARNSTWYEEESLALMREFDIANVISQSSGRFPYSEAITAKNIYIRFHGPERLYSSGYTDEMLQDYANKFKSWVNEGHHIWAFFNNDNGGYALKDARKLRELSRT